MRTIHDDIATVTTLPAATYDTTTDGTAVDTRGYDAVEVVLTLGEYADDSHVLTIEDSNDGQSFTPASATDIVGDDWPALSTTPPSMRKPSASATPAPAATCASPPR